MTIFVRNHRVVKNKFSFNLFNFSTRFITESAVQRSQEYYFVKAKGENYRLHLAKAKHLVGLRWNISLRIILAELFRILYDSTFVTYRTARGIREFNDDRFQTLVLELNDKDISNTKEQAAALDDENSGIISYEGEGKEGQICYFAIFDGCVYN